MCSVNKLGSQYLDEREKEREDVKQEIERILHVFHVSFFLGSFFRDIDLGNEDEFLDVTKVFLVDLLHRRFPRMLQSHLKISEYAFRKTVQSKKRLVQNVKECLRQRCLH